MKKIKSSLSTILFFVFLSVNVAAVDASFTSGVYSFFGEIFESIEFLIGEVKSSGDGSTSLNENEDPSNPDDDDCDVRICTNCKPSLPDCRP